MAPRRPIYKPPFYALVGGQWKTLPALPWKKDPDAFATNDDAADVADPGDASVLARHVIAFYRLQMLRPNMPLHMCPPWAPGAVPDGPVGAADIEDSAAGGGAADNSREAPADFHAGASTANTLELGGPCPAEWAARKDVVTQQAGGYLSSSASQTPVGAVENSDGTDPLFPHQRNHESKEGTQTWLNAFTDLGVSEPGDPQNTYKHMLRTFDTSAEAGVLGSHFGTVAGAVALYLVGKLLSDKRYTSSRHGEYMQSIYAQYSQHRSIMLHATALAVAAARIAKKSARGASLQLATYTLAPGAGKSFWFPPPGAFPGLLHQVTTSSGAQIGVLQLIPDIVIETRQSYKRPMLFVIELKTRHSEKPLSDGTVGAYWRQTVMQATQRWATRCSAIPSNVYRPNGRPPPAVFATLVVSFVTGSEPRGADTRAWHIKVDASVARRVYATMLLHSTEDDVQTDPPGATKRITYAYDGTAGPVQVMDKDNPTVFSDVGVAAIADMLTEPPQKFGHSPLYFARHLTGNELETDEHGAATGWVSPTKMTTSARGDAVRVIFDALSKWQLETYKPMF